MTSQPMSASFNVANGSAPSPANSITVTPASGPDVFMRGSIYEVTERALVVGGTGPTGVWIVHGLVERGWDVTILHRGAHERAETPPSVRHLHHDPYNEADLRTALVGQT